MTIPSIITPYTFPTDTELSHNPPSWSLDPSRAVLLVHDMQRYFLRAYPEGGEPLVGTRRNIGALRDVCRDIGIPVVYTVKPGGVPVEERGLERDFWGSGMRAIPEHTDIDPGLEPGPDDLLVTKSRYSAFVGTGLAEHMAEWGRDQVIVTGVYAHIGCQITAADAFMRDIQPFFVADAVADFSHEHHFSAMRYVAGRCGCVVRTKALIEHARGQHGADTSGSGPFSAARVRADIATVLGERAQDIDPEENLLERGLDSIRLMSLIETWHASGARADLADLAESPTVTSWAALLSR